MSGWGMALSIAVGIASIGAVVVCYSACVVAGIADDEEELARASERRS